jgi:hypothetical protein
MQEGFKEQSDHAVYMWLLWMWTVFACDQGEFILTILLKTEKYFLNVSKRNETGINIPDQPDEVKRVQGSIECVTFCHLD